MRAHFAIFASFAFTIGCSGSSDGGSNGTDSGTANDDGTGGDTNEGLDVGGQGNLGFVFLRSDDLHAVVGGVEFDHVDGSASASFLTIDAPSTGCTSTTSGACTFLHCDAGFTPARATSHSAGPIRITGGSTTSDFSITPSSTGAYSAYVSQNPLWKSGDRIIVSAPGADVGAFTVSALVPPIVTLSTPAIGARSAAVAVDRSKSLHFAWAGGGSDDLVQIVLNGPTVSGVQTQVACSFPANTHAADVDASLLAQLPTGKGSATLQQTTSAESNAGAWRVHLSMSSSISLADGEEATGEIDLQ